MSTRGLIAIEDADKTCRSCYLHFDSYVDGAGRVLVNHYKTAEKVEALLALGFLSALGERLAPESGEKHDYDNPLRDVCIAYHRDRGEELRPSTVWKNADDMLAQASDKFWAEYCYLFRDGKWYVDSTYQPHGWRLVENVLDQAGQRD
jgi:hypothetical protein